MKAHISTTKTIRGKQVKVSACNASHGGYKRPTNIWFVTKDQFNNLPHDQKCARCAANQ